MLHMRISVCARVLECGLSGRMARFGVFYLCLGGKGRAGGGGLAGQAGRSGQPDPGTWCVFLVVGGGGRSGPPVGVLGGKGWSGQLSGWET